MTAADQPTTEPSRQDLIDAVFDFLDQYGPTDLGYDDTKSLAVRLVDATGTLYLPATQPAADTERLREALANADKHRHEYGAQWIVALADEVQRLRALVPAADTETEVTEVNEAQAYALRTWIGTWPCTPGDGTFLSSVALDGLARADRIERGEEA